MKGQTSTGLYIWKRTMIACIIFTTVSNLILPELSIFVVLGFVIVSSRHNCPLFILGYDWFPSNDASFPVSYQICTKNTFFNTTI
jgi:hypothetical protein